MKNAELPQQFVVWQYNAHIRGLSDSELNKALPGVDRGQNILTRDITLFRKVGEYYRKSKELHKANLYPHEQIVAFLNEVGFETTLFKEYGDLKLEDHHFGFMCRKN